MIAVVGVDVRWRRVAVAVARVRVEVAAEKARDVERVGETRARRRRGDGCRGRRGDGGVGLRGLGVAEGADRARAGGEQRRGDRAEPADAGRAPLWSAGLGAARGPIGTGGRYLTFTRTRTFTQRPPGGMVTAGFLEPFHSMRIV